MNKLLTISILGLMSIHLSTFIFRPNGIAYKVKTIGNMQYMYEIAHSQSSTKDASTMLILAH
ncbi:MAG: hypothetical protein LBH49_00360 [Puniceicoccales bacterium]|nr:hypothetical protein [Puniceicoccales bacterium]